MNSTSQRLKTDGDTSLAHPINRTSPPNSAAHPETKPALSPKPSRGKKPWAIVIGLLCIVLVAVAVRRIWFLPKTGSTTGRDTAQPVPVVVGVAATKDVPIYLD